MHNIYAIRRGLARSASGGAYSCSWGGSPQPSRAEPSPSERREPQMLFLFFGKRKFTGDDYKDSTAVPRTGGRQVLRGVAQYGMTPVDSAKTEVTMRFPVKNCYSKVIVSESLEIFWKYYYYYYIRKYT